MEKKIYRLIDANINRSLEGLRVVEDICRFIIDDKRLTIRLKKIRHQIKGFSNSFLKKEGLISYRNIIKDVGKSSVKSEVRRKNIFDLFKSNIKRLEESIRVLEEFSKLVKVDYPDKFKKMRYATYDLEKKISSKLIKMDK